MEDQPPAKHTKPQISQASTECVPAGPIPGIPASCTPCTGYLAEKYPHPRDHRIQFDDEPHHYYVDWTGDGTYDREHVESVTTFVHHGFPEFDADAIIKKMRASPNWRKSKYKGMSDFEIKAQWEQNGKEARETGTKMHALFEDYFNGSLVERPPTMGVEYDQFMCFTKTVADLTPFRTEKMVFTDETTKLCGSVDMLFVVRADVASSTLVLRMYDWKRSKKISKYNRWGRGNCPATAHLPDANFFHYSLQLSTYKWIIEKYYGGVTYEGKQYDNVVIDELYIVVCHPNRKKFLRVKLPYMKEVVEAMVELRKYRLARALDPTLPEQYPAGLGQVGFVEERKNNAGPDFPPPLHWGPGPRPKVVAPKGLPLDEILFVDTDEEANAKLLQASVASPAAPPTPAPSPAHPARQPANDLGVMLQAFAANNAPAVTDAAKYVDPITRSLTDTIMKQYVSACRPVSFEPERFRAWVRDSHDPQWHTVLNADADWPGLFARHSVQDPILLAAISLRDNGF